MSVRQRAVDLLYAMCDRSNAEEIVGEMLEYLESADYSIREEMVSCLYTDNIIHVKIIICFHCLFKLYAHLPLECLLHFLSFIHFSQVLKVAILAEKYAVDYTWYVDVILNLIRIAGDYVSEEVSSSISLHGSNYSTH